MINFPSVVLVNNPSGYTFCFVTKYKVTRPVGLSLASTSDSVVFQCSTSQNDIEIFDSEQVVRAIQIHRKSQGIGAPLTVNKLAN